MAGKHSARRIAALVCAVKRLSWRLDSEWWEDVSDSRSTRTHCRADCVTLAPFPENVSVDFEAAGRRGYIGQARPHVELAEVTTRG
jgi:hypothetical protein